MIKPRYEEDITPDIERKIKKATMIKGQYDDERVILFLHRHGIVFAGHVVILMTLILIPIAVFVIGPELVPKFFEPPYGELLLFLTVIYIMFVWLYFFVSWVDYYLDAWVVTNRRIINIEQIGLFKRIVSVQSLGNVQDTTSEVVGILRSLLNFGNVEVQTAAEQQRFKFEDVPEPDRVKEIITKLSQEYKQNHRQEAGPGK